MASVSSKALWVKEKEELADRIWVELSKRWAPGQDLVLKMKSGSTVTIRPHYVPARRIMRRWHSHTYYYEVFSTAMEEPRWFRTLERLSRAMAYGFIK